jgi:hypothetical protein
VASPDFPSYRPTQARSAALTRLSARNDLQHNLLRVVNFWEYSRYTKDSDGRASSISRDAEASLNIADSNREVAECNGII